MGAGLYPTDAPIFRPSFWLELRDLNPFGFPPGTPRLSERDVADWFYFVKYARWSTYHYKRKQATIRRWWADALPIEIAKARHVRAVLEGRSKPGDWQKKVERRYQRERRAAEMPQMQGARGEEMESMTALLSRLGIPRSSR